MDYKLNKKLKLHVSVKTFHEFGLKFIKNVKIIDDKNRFNIIYDIVCNLLNKNYYLFKTYMILDNSLLLFSKKDKIKHYICNNITLDCIKYIDKIKVYGEYKNKTITFKIFNIIFKKIYNEYNKYLKINNLIEFEDIIINANIKNVNYKYVIVDEYQDISKNRFIFLKKLLDYTNASFIGVGDDFQAIYGFSGSNVNYFINLKEYIPDLKILIIINTYRNSQELINVAGNFILKDKKMINKSLKSNKNIKSPIILIYYKSRVEALFKILNNINNGTVGILSRFNFDNDEFLNHFKKENDHYIYKNLKLYFMTIHKSKGLEFDNVIITNNNKGIYGFPSNKINKKIFKQFKLDLNEERRLFYVGLTRTKNRVYLMVNKHNKSSFIKEIKKEIKISHL